MYKRQDKTKASDEYNESWTEPKRKPTKQEHKKLLGIGIGICVTSILENHCYTYNGITYKQDPKKESIGLNLQRAVSSVYMARWGNQFKCLLEEIETNNKKIKETENILMKPIMMNFYVMVML